MPKLTVSRPAQSDLRAIARYTHDRWGAVQAVKYLKGLEGCFQSLAQSPEAGRGCAEISPGLYRHEYARHVVFYRLKPAGIRAVRVLHQRMLPAKPHF